MNQSVKRLQEIDFLRGIAILLVLLRHKELFSFTKTMGWIGVDLFFVLSGFLVSGLLFKEYQKSGKVNISNFLIRRGFKIYPIYYLFYIPYLLILIFDSQFNLVSMLSDLFFVQNYVLGYGYAYAATWSLAVEEHFYFTLALLIWYLTKHRSTYLIAPENKISKFEILIFSVLICCLILRILSNFIWPNETERNFTMTHLRMDSLLFGVLIAYLFNFRKSFLETLNKGIIKVALLFIFAFSVSWTAFIEPEYSFFVKTFGFSLLYFGFGSLLLVFLIEKNILQYLNNIFSKIIVKSIATIGYSSYSIYVIHTLVNKNSNYFFECTGIGYNHYLDFIIAFIVSIFLGIFMTEYIETYFLRIRNRYFPTKLN
jgi:peptidoglycan/LPS O-acetylase OafA/YrhL